MQKNVNVQRFEEAAAILPSRLRSAALALPEEEKAAAEELRLRAGRPLTVLLPGGERPLGAEVMTGGGNPFYRKIGYEKGIPWTYWRR